MSENKNPYEHLCYKPKDASKTFSEEKIKSAFDFSEGFKDFLNQAKTERESVVYALDLAKKNGFLPLEYGKEYQKGDKIYYVNRDKALILAVILPLSGWMLKNISILSFMLVGILIVLVYNIVLILFFGRTEEFKYLLNLVKKKLK